MSHEVRTPLNAIIGFSNLLTYPAKKPEKIKSFVDMISVSSEKLIGIITDVIDISQIHSNQIKITNKNFEIISLIKNIVNKFSNQAAIKNINLIFKIPYDLKEYYIFSDCEKIQRIISHIIENAVKFTPEGNVEIDFEINQGNINLTVSDTGIGIPEMMQQIIFEPFRQVESGICWNFGGNGLGLPIVKPFFRNSKRFSFSKIRN